MEDQDKIVIGRRWGPHTMYIRAVTNSEKIETSLPIEQFVRTIAHAMPSPLFMMTKAQMERALVDAVEKVLTEIKRASTEVR